MNQKPPFDTSMSFIKLNTFEHDKMTQMTIESFLPNNTNTRYLLYHILSGQFEEELIKRLQENCPGLLAEIQAVIATAPPIVPDNQTCTTLHIKSMPDE